MWCIRNVNVLATSWRSCQLSLREASTQSTCRHKSPFLCHCSSSMIRFAQEHLERNVRHIRIYSDFCGPLAIPCERLQGSSFRIAQEKSAYIMKGCVANFFTDYFNDLDSQSSCIIWRITGLHFWPTQFNSERSYSTGVSDGNKFWNILFFFKF
jgi:hypothetical protein